MTLTKVFSIAGPNLVILDWTGPELSHGQVSDWHTDKTRQDKTRQDRQTDRPRKRNQSGMTPVWRTYVVWGLYVNRGSAFVDLGSLSGRIFFHQVNSDIINVSCFIISCQRDSDDNKIYVIWHNPLESPFICRDFLAGESQNNRTGRLM